MAFCFLIVTQTNINTPLMKKITLTITFFFLFFAQVVLGQNYTFDMENAIENNGVVTQTVNGVTMTFTSSDNDAVVYNNGSSKDVYNQNLNADNVTITFSKPINISTLLASNDLGANFTFTPSGGTNIAVTPSYIIFSELVYLNWTNVSSITVTSSKGKDSFILDNIKFTMPNAVPVIGGAVANQTVNDNSTINPFASITTTDADGDNLSATITLDTNAKGVLTGTGLSGTGPYTIASTSSANLQTYLRGISFNPTDNRTATSETTTFAVVVSDGSASSTNNTTTVISSAVAPTVTSVAVPASGTYLSGQNLDFTVNFSENVTVSGTPQLGITIGSAARQANYVSGSGASPLVFRYTVQTGDLDTDGIAVGTLALNGGTIKDAGGKDATLTLNSVDTTTAVLVDAVAPTITSVAVPLNDTYVIGQEMDFTINLDENVNVFTADGTPELAITIGSNLRQAVYVIGSGGKALAFRHIVQAGDLDADGIVVGSLTTNGGAIKDAAGNNANITLNSVGSTTNVLVDGSATGLTSITVPSNKTYIAGDNLDFAVNFNHKVNVFTAGGNPQLAITIGSTTRQAQYVIGSGNKSIAFRYTVQVGDLDSDGIVVGNLTTNGGAIKDAGSNDADLILNSVGATTGVLVDAVVPIVTSVTVPATATYATAQNLNFTVNFNENIIVTGTPQLVVTIGSTARQANYVSGSGTSALVFRYIVLAGDLDTDGITVGTLALNGGSIKDAASNNATLTLNSVGVTTGVLVDATIAPNADNIIYVNKNATGTGKGNTWDNAVTELATALNWAKVNPNASWATTPLKVYVAIGTYYPTTVNTDRDASFTLGANIKIYGGFDPDNSITAIDDARIFTNGTILSGDIDKNDTPITPAPSSGNLYENNAGNSYHVVNASTANVNSLLDGVQISFGNANGSYPNNLGGGVYSSDSSSVIKLIYSLVSNNSATLGGGVYSQFFVMLTNSTVSHNSANNNGGGVCVYEYDSYSSVIFTNSTVINNFANANGAGVYLAAITASFSINIYNSLFANGEKNYYGNNIIRNSYIEGEDLSASNNNLNGVAIAPTSIFKDYANGDYTLKNTSPAVNAGSNDLYTGTLGADKDLAGNARLLGSVTTDVIDVGAYELQEEPFSPDENNILYVDKTANGTGKGSSWENSISELADALVWAKLNYKASWATTPLQIYVAGGTYKPLYSPKDGVDFGTDQTRDNTFLMVNNVEIYGGFAGIETALADRDLSVVANQTILSGDLGTANENTDNAYHVMVSAGEVGTARLDGFTITGGYANSTDKYVVNTKEAYSCSGAGIYNSESNPLYKNLIIKENSCSESGGGMFSYSSTPNLQNVAIENNQAKDGGGMANQYHSYATLLNVLIKNNNASLYGNGLYNVDQSSATLTNSSIVGNKATIDNQTVVVPVGCASQNSSVTLKNSIVWDDITGDFTAEYSLIKDKSNTDNGNIDATVLTDVNIFIDPNNGDYTLKNTSPALNAGSNDLYTGTLGADKDLAGNARLFGSVTSDVIDMGAYEFQENPFKPAPTTTYATQIYAGDDKTIAELQVTGTAIKWYDAATAGSVVATTTSLVDATTYYASQTLDEVESTERVAVMAKRISDANQNRLAGSTVANLASTPTTGTIASWFTEATGGNALKSTDVLNTATYYVEQNNAGVLSNRVAVTVDLAPSITTLSPADDAKGVTVTSNLVITFDENVVKGTGDINIYNVTDDYIVETINVLGSNVTITDASVTINPIYNLDKSKTYAVQIAATAFKDVKGNAFAGILDKTTWSFASELNLAPTAIALSASAINENVAAASIVGTLSTTDTDSHAFTYSLVSGTGDTDNTAFTISGNDLKINVSPDFETKASYSVRVRTSDGILTLEKAFTITVNDVNEVPTVIAITVTATVSQTKVYGQNDPVFTYTVSPALLSGDIFTGSLSRVAGNDVGTYAIGLGTLSAGSNYSISYVGANFSITKADQPIIVPTKCQPNLIRQQFEDVIFFDNSSKEFKSYTWYKDGILVAGQTLQYYKEAGGLSGTYHAVATKLDGAVIMTCPLILSSTITVETLKIVPNPVKSNASYQLVTNVEVSQMQNAHVEVYSIAGALLNQMTTNEGTTTLQAPSVEGIYVIRMTLANGKTFTKNLLVKN
jgi:hypothetical protein